MNITLTGPRSVGKTTLGKLLAKKLKLQYLSSDEIGNKAMKKEGGLDKAIKSGAIKKVIEKKGYNLIHKVYKKEKNYVFDLSGGAFTYQDIPKISEEVRKDARKNSIVIGLLPSRCRLYSILILYSREIKREHFKDAHKPKLFWKTFKRYFRFPKIFKKYTHFTIYTRGKTPDEISSEIVEKIRLRASSRQ
jgi:shikimate kinase